MPACEMNIAIWSLKVKRKTGLIKQSLYNVFKMLRPVVVLDEAHKAYGASKREANEEFAQIHQPP